MCTQQDQSENSKAIMDRREPPRFEPPMDAYVDVKTSRGSKMQARVLDMSALGGACLVFDEDSQLEEGDVVSVSYGLLINEGEVRHVGHKYGKHLVGVRWLKNATMLSAACGPT